eukprot:15435488-Alexandrium_andersonii.AAC.1
MSSSAIPAGHLTTKARERPRSEFGSSALPARGEVRAEVKDVPEEARAPVGDVVEVEGAVPGEHDKGALSTRRRKRSSKSSLKECRK